MADSVERNSILGWLVDPLSPTRDAADRAFQFTADRRAWLAPIGLGIALLAISVVGLILEPKQFYFSYLTGWAFLLTTAVGGLFFLFFQHLTKAAWSVTTRRINEALVWSFPLLALLGIPILFGMHDLYHWTHAELYDPNSPQYDEILAGKRAYLNTPFWAIRMVLYFALFTFISYRLYSLSIKMDMEGPGSRDDGIPAKLRTTSAWGLPLAAIATAFCSYDVLMSTDPHWFSTIFGVYFFSGGILAAVSTIALVAALLQKTGGMLTGIVTAEHYQDLGKYMFGFVVFWAYIAFSQYMLYWYGGIPEEIVWYQHRLEGAWAWHSAMLLILHFIVPFLILLPRFPKRSTPILSIMAVWLIGMHWFDIHWVVRPVMSDAATFHWLDFTTWLGLTFVFGGSLMYRLSRHSLVPEKDPYLADSLHFENT
jgi:hypothetical protein